MINRDRMTRHVDSLVRIDSESRSEREIARRLKEELEALGAEVQIDDADRKVGGNAGNLIAYVRGNKPNIPPFLISAHLDTVVPGKGVRPLLSPKVLKTDGNTILGGDDKSGLSIIVEALRTLKEREIPHPDLEIVLTVCEEVGLLGAKAVDPKRLSARDGLVLDSEHASILTTEGPAAVRMEVVVRGLEAHAGVAPERGLSAIKIAADAIARMKLGRIDQQTTANIGVIQGGLATNIIPNEVRLKGEARSRDVKKLKAQVRHMIRCLEEAARKHRLKANGKSVTGRIESHVDSDYSRLHLGKGTRVVKLAKLAAKKLGYPLQEGATGGGSDANVYNKWNIRVANLGTGMRDIHTVKEWLDLDDFERAANLVTEMIALYPTLGHT